MRIRFEAAEATATALLAALHRACFPQDPWNEAAIAELFALPGFFARIACSDDMPVGFALALDLGGGECEILSLAVLPGKRGAGAGRALLADLCREAGRRGAAAMLLEVAANNPAARGLYDAAGFVPIGCRCGYYRYGGVVVDALVLRLALAAPPST